MIDYPLPPNGTEALVVSPWHPQEVYGVAARWGDASSPIFRATEDGWLHLGWQVGDFGHDPESALREDLRQAIAVGGDPGDDVDLSEILSGAVWMS